MFMNMPVECWTIAVGLHVFLYSETSAMNDAIKHEWPNIKFAEDEKDKQIAELKAENERLRIALMELERLAREALGG